MGYEGITGDIVGWKMKDRFIIGAGRYSIFETYPLAAQ